MFKKIMFSFCFLLTICNSASFAQDDASMKAFMEYMTPGDQHKEMAAMAGNWDVSVKMYQPGMPEPISSKGTATLEMFLGGRYLKSTFHGDIMGMVMEGFSIDAYDKALDEYISIWLDNMGTGIMVSKGKWNKETKVIELYGAMVDPITKTEKKSLTVIQHSDKNKMFQKIYLVDGDKRDLSLEMEFTRSK